MKKEFYLRFPEEDLSTEPRVSAGLDLTSRAAEAGLRESDRIIFRYELPTNTDIWPEIFYHECRQRYRMQLLSGLGVGTKSIVTRLSDLHNLYCRQKTGRLIKMGNHLFLMQHVTDFLLIYAGVCTTLAHILDQVDNESTAGYYSCELPMAIGCCQMFTKNRLARKLACCQVPNSTGSQSKAFRTRNIISL